MSSASTKQGQNAQSTVIGGSFICDWLSTVIVIQILLSVNSCQDIPAKGLTPELKPKETRQRREQKVLWSKLSMKAYKL